MYFSQAYLRKIWKVKFLLFILKEAPYAISMYTIKKEN